ncbi:MAG TPA: ankyrin repeat domain-containing protein [Candidatus Acidoferrales bacterium]
MRKIIAAAVLSVCVFWGISRAQEPRKLDFARDVQPIFKSKCIGCHGPVQQKNGLRLDRRSDAMRGGTIADIGPGNSAGSRLYLRLAGAEYGLQMPPTGPLSAAEVNIIKDWIDQGAEWPDALAGETAPPPPDGVAGQMMDTLRRGDRPAFQKLIRDNPGNINKKGPAGSTPLMYAALYSDVDSVRQLLKMGADPNLQNEAGATALMWATDNLEIVTELVEHGADVNAKSGDSRTPLLIAAGRYGAAPVVKSLLDHGANPSAHSPGLGGDMTPLAEAAYVGDETVLRMLVARGADVKAAGPNPLGLAIVSRCSGCIDLFIGSTEKDDLSLQALLDSPPLNDTRGVNSLLDHGANVNAKDPDGNTLLMLVSACDEASSDTVKRLIAGGADVNAKNPRGQTALDFASVRGKTAILSLLVESGAKDSGTPTAQQLDFKPAGSVREAVQRSIPLLQHTDVMFAQKSGCISCHNNTFTAVSVAGAREKRIAVNENIVQAQMKTYGTYIESWRERVLQGVGIPGDADTMSYILVGMAAEHYSADTATDAMVRFLKNHQRSDGSWIIFAQRPPIEASDIEVTVNSMRAMQIYAPPTQRVEYDRAIRLAADWIAAAKPRNNEDRAFQLLGLAWAKRDQQNINAAAHSLVAQQRSDGGWAQIPSLPSDAYATGQALVALRESGAIAISDPVFTRGVQFLMSTQLADGSWYVKSRAMRIQPFFESGFPYGRDQFVSAAGTNWATQALALAAR